MYDLRTPWSPFYRGGLLMSLLIVIVFTASWLLYAVSRILDFGIAYESVSSGDADVERVRINETKSLKVLVFEAMLLVICVTTGSSLLLNESSWISKIYAVIVGAYIAFLFLFKGLKALISVARRNGIIFLNIQDY